MIAQARFLKRSQAMAHEKAYRQGHRLPDLRKETMVATGFPARSDQVEIDIQQSAHGPSQVVS